MKYEFNSDELLTALQNGTAPDTLAQAFADALNGAIAAKEEADKKNLVNAKRINAIDEIIDLVADFVQTYYPDIYDEKVFTEIDAENIDKVLYEAYVEVKQMEPLFDVLKKKPTSINVKFNRDNTKNNADQTLNNFLKRNGL